MASWADSLIREWDEQDRRTRAGLTPCCGRHDYVVIYREGDLARVKCRHCLVDSTVRA